MYFINTLSAVKADQHSRSSALVAVVAVGCSKVFPQAVETSLGRDCLSLGFVPGGLVERVGFVIEFLGTMLPQHRC